MAAAADLGRAGRKPVAELPRGLTAGFGDPSPSAEDYGAAVVGLQSALGGGAASAEGSDYAA